MSGRSIESMASEEPSINCPHCGSKLSKEDISVVMFSKASVLACPFCKKTLSLQPKEF
jgi:hypothetical protein